MTKGQLEQLWKQAGGNPASAGVAAAVALAESSGNPGATNYNTNATVDRGLWQINSIHGGQSTYDLLANAKAAVSISNNGTNWSPWVTYNTGAYAKYLGASSSTGTAGGSAPGSSSPSGSGGSSGGSSSSGGLPGGLLGVAVKGTTYLALLIGAAAMLWLGSKTFLQPKSKATA